MFQSLIQFLKMSFAIGAKRYLRTAQYIFAIILLLSISVGFATSGIYQLISSSRSKTEAAFFVALGYGFAALLITIVFWLRRRRRLSHKNGQEFGWPFVNRDLHEERGAPTEVSETTPDVLADFIRLGSEVTIVQVAILAIVAGIISGRYLRR